MDSSERILTSLFSLLQGHSLSIAKHQNNYGISKRTAQRDISLIRIKALENGYDLTYNHLKQSYSLSTKSRLDTESSLAISKILIESRAFIKPELVLLLKQLSSNLDSDQTKLLKQLTSNELNSYKPLNHNRELFPLIKQFIPLIRKNTLVKFDYINRFEQTITREGVPVSIYFSEYYFYIITYVPKQQINLYYRLDRFKNIRPIKNYFHLSRNQRLEDGTIRMKSHLMYGGNEVTFTFRFWGIVEAAIDYLPTAKVIKQYSDNSVLIEASGFDKGMIMWILSQGSKIKVESPPSFVEKMHEEITLMQALYSKNES